MSTTRPVLATALILLLAVNGTGAAVAHASALTLPPPAVATGSTPPVAAGHDGGVQRVARTVRNADPTPGEWVWPLAGFRIAQPYRAPADEYGPGHRGIDLTPLSAGPVRAPAAGVVAFSGRVADRDVLTIDHGGGLVTTLEPVESALAAGTAVERGEVVGRLGLGGHAAPGDLHFGVRRDGAYINPLLLLGGVPRAVLLPCCR
jgi:murein DD-endopeptidase MepM/ murein hydrolase activator NlpD